MLASDLNNPEFVGATNPDALLHVEFYMYEPIDKWGSEEESQKQGRKVVKKLPAQPFVRIMRPGDQTSIIETPVREEHKARWPERWMYFQMAEGLADPGANIPGWKIEDWDYLNDKPDLLHQLKFQRFYTVELIAGAADTQVQRIGMAGVGLREQARAALRKKVSAEMNAAVEEKQKEIDALKAADKEKEDRLARLEAALLAQTDAPARKKPGPKPKEEVIG